MTRDRRFVPTAFILTDELRTWAREKYRVTDEEICRQFEMMRDHEFRRDYTCWQRVFRNWMRKADELSLLKRDRKLRTPTELTEDERVEEILKWQRDLERLKKIRPPLKVVK
jgi:hypothetical protein